MIEAYSKANFWNFSFLSPWKTNIDPGSRKSKGIDHIFVDGVTKLRSLNPAEIISDIYGLVEMIAPLTSPQN